MQAGEYNGQEEGFLSEGNDTLLICFIRHAESESNVGHPTTYTHQDRLTERGRHQAKDIPQKLGEIAQKFEREPDLIVTSPYRRARETARPTRLKFPDTPYRIWPVEEFTYLGMGGKLTTNEERQKRRHDFWNASDPDHTDETGESFNHFIARVRLTLECLRHQEANFIVVFSHEQFIQAVLEILSRRRVEPFETPETMRRFRLMLTEQSMPHCRIYPIRLPRAERNTYQNHATSYARVPWHMLVSMCKR